MKPKSFREYPMFVALFYWWFKEAPQKIIYVSQKIITYFYNYFSIPLLFRTLLDPWKKDEIDTTNMSLDDIIKVWFMNLVARLVGASVRSITILAGLLLIGITFLASIIFFLGFIFLPAIIIYLIINGFSHIQNGLL